MSLLYHAAFQAYLKAGPKVDVEPARDLGRHVMLFGLETPDLARMYEIAVVALVLPGYSSSKSDEMMGWAGVFFAEAITPLEETHRFDREANMHLNKTTKALAPSTVELADFAHELKVEIAQWRVAEKSFRTCEMASSRLLVQSRQMEEEPQKLSRQIISAQEERRRKIGRELHDVIAQTLTCINMRLAFLKGEATATTKDLQKKISSTQILVEKSVDIVRLFTRELRHSMLDDPGLIPALQSYMKGFMEDTGIRVRLSVFSGVEQADGNTCIVLYHIVQEALTNVSRHAKPGHAEVIIQNREGLIRMEIKGDGQDFEVDGTTQAKTKNNRLGLLGMRERAEMIGVTFCVESTHGKRRRGRVEVPAATSDTQTSKIETSNPSST